MGLKQSRIAPRRRNVEEENKKIFSSLKTFSLATSSLDGLAPPLAGTTLPTGLLCSYVLSFASFVRVILMFPVLLSIKLYPALR